MPDQPQNPQHVQGGGDNAPGGAGSDIGAPGVNPSTGKAGQGPGASEAGIVGIVALALYLVLFTLFVIYCLVVIWPVPTPSRDAPPSGTPSPPPTPTVTPSATQTPTAVPTPTPTPTPPRTIPASGQASASSSPSPSPSPSPTQPAVLTFLWWQFNLWDEQRLLLLVLLGGALGSLVHSLRSVYWYIGYRNLVKSWMAMYLMLPFTGAALALVFYLVVRGGFFSPQASFQQTSPFGFAAFAALIGMFSSQAVLKLKEVAEVLLSKPGPGANARPQEPVQPGVVNPPPPGGKAPNQP